jgi:hypothetical protein
MRAPTTSNHLIVRINFQAYAFQFQCKATTPQLSYIAVSDLVRKRPIWFGGEDRSEANMAAFCDWLGPVRARGRLSRWMELRRWMTVPRHCDDSASSRWPAAT